MTKEEFLQALANDNINLNEKQIDLLDRYLKLLQETNQVTNLTTIAKTEDVYLKHFYDSLMILRYIDFKVETKVLDFGTGAGIPGIPLAIFYPEVNFTLLDSVGKKTNFIKEVVIDLGLTNVNVINDRVEAYAKNNTEAYDYIITRAVASLPVLLELSHRLLKMRGMFIAMKAGIDDELKQSACAIKKLGYKEHKIVRYNLPIEEAARSLVLLTKTKITASKYPRDYSQIKKKPL